MEESTVDLKVCRKIIEQVLDPKIKFEIIDFELRYCEDLIGFHGQHAKLHIHCRLGDNKKSFQFFYKGAAELKSGYDGYLSVIRAFEKEDYMHEVVLVRLNPFVKQSLSAKCYFSQLNKFIVFEDLTLSGYEGQRAEMDAGHAFVALEELALLHAASFIAEQEASQEIIEIFPKLNFETMLTHKEKPAGLLLRATHTLVKYLMTEKIDKFKGDDVGPFAEWFTNTLSNSVLPSDKFKNCLCHGDPWGGNILYKYSKEGKPEKASLIDFQLSRIAPPAVDFTMFLSLQFSLSQESRLAGPLLSHYLKALGSHLASAGIAIDRVLPRQEFLDSLAAFSEFAACIRLHYTIFTRFPTSLLRKILHTPDSYLRFLTVGDTQAISQGFDSSSTYRNELEECFKNAFQIFQKRKIN